LLEDITLVGNGSISAITKSSGDGDLLISRLSAKQLLESDQAVVNAKSEAVNDGIWLVLLMLPLALLLFRKNLIWIILLSVMLPNERELYAREWDGFWNHVEEIAFEAYLTGDYQTSYELSQNPFLQAAAYYQDGQYQLAQQRFAADDSAQSIYNLGNALAQQQLFPEAIVAYQKALALNPGFKSAQYNKGLIELYLEQQLASGSEASTASAVDDSLSNELHQLDAEMAIGITDQYQTNPADDQQLGPGLGASTQSNQVDPFERFNGQEQEMERFVLRSASGEQLPDREFIEDWIRSLPETSTDLFRRKFSRDYQRQKQQAR